MNLPLKIAFRYLFARKSYQVINLISGIGVAGMAIGTAALVCILSVFNGFNRLVSENLLQSHPDLVVLPASGKVFIPEGPAFQWALESEDVLRLSSTLEEQVFVSYEGKQSLARVKGLDEASEAESPLQAHIVDGKWALHTGNLPSAVMGAALARSLGLSPAFVNPIELFFPSRTSPVSLANPAASLRSVRLRTAGLVSVSSELDAKLLLVPMETARELLDYDKEVSAIEIWTAPGQEKAVQKQLQERLGASFKVQDRYQQNDSLYKMMRYEKLAIYLILIFVVLIISLNIYSSLKMLILEKSADRETLRSLGAPAAMVRRIFLLEGWLVSMLGLVIGLVLGVLLVGLQSRFGLVSMPGNFVISAYPVVLKASDLVWITAGVASVGYLISWLPSKKL